MQLSKRLFALSRRPQADHNTAPTPGNAPKNFRQVVKRGYDFAAPETLVVDNTGYSTGTPNPTQTETDKHKYPFSLDERMTSQLLGERATAAFGLPVSAPIAGSLGAHGHDFAPLNPQLETDLPVFAYVEKEGEPADNADITDDRMLPSAGLESINFASGGDDAYLNAVSNWQPSGKIISPSGVNFAKTGTKHVLLDTEANENSLKAGHAVVKIHTTPNFTDSFPIEVGCAFRNVQIGYNTGTNFDAGYNCNLFAVAGNEDSGLIRGNAPSGNPSMTLAFTLLKSRTIALSFDPVTKLRAQTKFSISFKYVAALIAGITETPINHSADFQFLRLTVESINQNGEENGAATYAVQAKVLMLGLDYGFKLRLVNNVASYATL